MGDVASAIRFHERHLKIAVELGDEERLNTANRQLLEVYKRRAEELEKKNDHTSAVELYKKCLQASKDAGDLRAEGVACYRLGVTYSNLSMLLDLFFGIREDLSVFNRSKRRIGSLPAVLFGVMPTNG